MSAELYFTSSPHVTKLNSRAACILISETPERLKFLKLTVRRYNYTETTSPIKDTIADHDAVPGGVNTLRWRIIVGMTPNGAQIYRSIRFGVETFDPGLIVPRHRHIAGYATVVLRGAFEEASFAGRFAAQPGDVLLHGAFDCHANRTAARHALQILRLPWTDNSLEGHFQVPDVDLLARLAEQDLGEAVGTLRNVLRPRPAIESHWTERLAQTLRTERHVRLEEWAESQGLTPETVSRGFYNAFGVLPKVFRLETRARRAWNAIRGSQSSFTTIAYDLGFADPAHLTRAVRALTGAPPSHWRQSA
jgi:AraC-like DNA-binding protein